MPLTAVSETPAKPSAQWRNSAAASLGRAEPEKDLHLSPTFRAADAIHRRRIGYVITILHPGPEEENNRRPHLDNLDVQHITLVMHDAEDRHCGALWDRGEGDVMPGHQHVSTAIDFSCKAQASQKPLLIHDATGRTCSAALYLAILAARFPKGQEPQAVGRLFGRYPKVAPNLRLVRLADEVLQRIGRLQEYTDQEMELPHIAHNYAEMSRGRELRLQALTA